MWLGRVRRPVEVVSHAPVIGGSDQSVDGGDVNEALNVEVLLEEGGGGRLVGGG